MVAEKLELLSKLQEIDSKIDSIKKVRGALPDEVRDLEDEIAGYETRLQKFDDEIKGFEEEIADRKAKIKECEGLIKKYEEQQMNVRNNREYDAITKEMELQALEIQVAEKKRIRNSQGIGIYRLRVPHDRLGLDIKVRDGLDIHFILIDKIRTQCSGFVACGQSQDQKPGRQGQVITQLPLFQREVPCRS